MADTRIQRAGGWTDLLRKDDWISVWIGFLILGAFVGAQAFNVLWTLLVAALLFGGILFPAPRF